MLYNTDVRFDLDDLIRLDYLLICAAGQARLDARTASAAQAECLLKHADEYDQTRAKFVNNTAPPHTGEGE